MEELTPPCCQTSSALQPRLCCKQHSHCVPNRACLWLINQSEFLFQVWYDHVGVTNMEELTPPCCQTSSALQPSICCKTACTQCAKQSMLVVDKPVRESLFQVWYDHVGVTNMEELTPPCCQTSSALQPRLCCKQHAHCVPNRACLLLINRSQSLF